MKKILLSAIALGIAFGASAQISKRVPAEVLNQAVKVNKAETVFDMGSATPQGYTPSTRNMDAIEEATIGQTLYDLQSNDAVENRVHRFADGTMAGVWTMGLESPNFAGRGAGYNYFDGSNWGDMPTERVEDVRTGWPSYAPLGDNGEIIVSHTGTTLKISTRENKGTGDWNYQELAGPDGYDILWPRVITNGNTIHLIGCIPNTANGGSLFEGLDGAIVYSRSLDGGATWVDENILLPGIDSDTYTGINADEYIWAQRGDVIALMITSNFYGHDTFILKSEDNGDTWEKTVIWENPYNLVSYDDLITEDTLSAPDGTAGVAIDNDGKVHVTFGLYRAVKEESGSGSGYSYFPFVEGIIYWNEDMPPFENENQHDALWLDNLTEDVNYIASVPDVNGDGEYGVFNADIETQVHSYRGSGITTMPTIQIDENNNIFVAYSTMMEDETNTSWLYRHVWAKAFNNGDQVWNDALDVTGDILHSFDECLSPQLFNIQSGDDKIFVKYTRDNIVGHALTDDDPQEEYSTNYITVAEVDYADFGSFSVDNENVIGFTSENKVSQNFPNPVATTTTVSVELNETAEVSLDVVNLVGQRVISINKGTVNAGTTQITIDASNLETGVYFYNVNINDEQITKKMIVK